MDVIINRTKKIPIYIQIVSQIKTMILSKKIIDGFILPSERMLATKLGVHRNTVVRAYHILQEEGLIYSTQRIGYRVSYLSNKNGERNKDEKSTKRSVKEVNWASAIKNEYLDVEKTFDDLFSKSYSEKTISFAGGMASSSVYSNKDIMNGIMNIFSNQERYAFYTPYQGIYGLRQEMSKFLRDKDMIVNPSEIQIFSETNQAMDFLLTLLIGKGDKVIIGELISPDVYRAFQLAGAQTVSVPMDENGIMCDNIDALIEKHNPKFIYVDSSYHDPTGVSLSLERRQKLLELSYKYRIPIIEDDWASEISFDGEKVPTLKALDKGKNVIYVYSFALTMIPGISLAFVAAPKAVIKSLSYLLSIRLISLDWISQQLLETYMKDGTYIKNIKRFIDEYRIKRDLMCSYLHKVAHLGIKCQKPAGGVYLWCKLPDNIDVKKLFKEAAQNGVSFMPGYVFLTHKNRRCNYIRLNYSRPTIEQIEKGMKILIELIKMKM